MSSVPPNDQTERTITVDELFAKRADLIDVVVTNAESKEFIMLAKVNKAAFLQTIQTGYVHYYDEYNQVVWMIGEHSEKRQKIVEITLDMCHARRHTLALHFKVALEPGQCKFGFSRCDFYRFQDGHFAVDTSLINNQEAFRAHLERIYTLTDLEGDRVSFLQRFGQARDKS